MKVLLVTLLLATSTAFAACEGFLPKNNLRIPVGMKLAGGLSQDQFNKVIDEVYGVMAPVVSAKGGKLNVIRSWTSDEVNAYASRTTGTTWDVEMFGGLARHPEITEEGFKLVLCHEIGHHIGGAPTKYARKWAAVEGQADYFGTLKCLRQVYLNADNAAFLKGQTLPAGLQAACTKAFKNADDKNICLRSGLAGQSVANLFASLGGSNVSYLTPDNSKILQTFEGHPQAQCRLDTFFAGLLCHVDFREDTSLTDETKGTCNVSTGDTIGVRPSCWYVPKK